MALLVQKFGGTSVGSLELINKVAKKVSQFKQEGNSIIVVVSAMSGETNKLLKMASTLSMTPCKRELDALLSTGEQVVATLLCIALQKYDCDASSLLGFQVPINTNSVFNKARIKHINTEKIKASLSMGKIVVVPGFQGCDNQNNITTLGRGGSDTTAVALAAALKADECQIYTDVDGVYTADPRVVNCARKLNKITFEEMLEMASLGSKVLQIRAVEFAGKYNVTLRVLHAFNHGEGTLIILQKENKMEAPVVSGIAFNRDEAKITIKRIPNKPGTAMNVLKPISDNNIEIDMIIQNVPEDGKVDFTFTVHKNDFDRAIMLAAQVSQNLKADSYSGDNNIAKVSIVGVGMKSHTGVATKIFQALANEGINIHAISTSEIKVSIIISEQYLELAVRVLHSTFNLNNELH